MRHRLFSTSFARRDRNQYKSLVELIAKCTGDVQSAERELSWIQKELPVSQWAKAAADRSKHYPLQYILGSQPFAHLDIECRENVLIPRPETEEWTLQVSECLKEICKNAQSEQRLNILDLCTGSGCIPLLLASTLSRMQKPFKVWGMDVSQDALTLAHDNLKRNKAHIDEEIGSVEFLLGDLFNYDFAQLKEVDLVTANPPYIPMHEYLSSETEESVRKYEPSLALIGGTEFYQAISERVVLNSLLNVKGFVAEVGNKEQITFTKAIFEKHNASQPEDGLWGCGYLKDYNENPRAVVCWKKDTGWDLLKGICNEIMI